jgi:hypothetical protein
MTIPGLTRTDPTIPKQILEAKLKLVDQRRAEIESYLTSVNPNLDSYHNQEIRAELSSLNIQRGEIQDILHPKAKPRRSPELQKLYQEQRQRDVEFLRHAIRQEIENTEHAAQKEEAAGNHRSARLHRSMIPDIPEQVCKQYDKNPVLLAEVLK